MKIFLEVIKYLLICYNMLIAIGIIISAIGKEKEDKLFNLLIFIFSGITIAYLFIK